MPTKTTNPPNNGSHTECQVFCSGDLCTLKCPRSIVENGAVFEQIDNPTKTQKEEEEKTKTVQTKSSSDNCKPPPAESPADIPKKVVIEAPGLTIDTNGIIGLIVTVILIVLLIWAIFSIFRRWSGPNNMSSTTSMAGSSPSRQNNWGWGNGPGNWGWLGVVLIIVVLALILFPLFNVRR